MRPLSRCNHVGDGVRVFGRPQIDNRGRIVIGPRAVLRAEPVLCHLATGPRGALFLGEGAVIEHGAGVAAHLSVTIGAGARIGPYALVMDTTFHDPEDFSKLPEPRAVIIGDGAIIGSHATVLPGSRIGAGAHVFAGSVVMGVVPPGARVRGIVVGGRPTVAKQIAGARSVAEALRAAERH